MRVFSLVMALLWFGCEGADISDNPPIGTSDAATIDATAIDATNIDSSGETDAAGDIDAPPGQPDADVNRAQVFCDRYDALCGYDNGDPNRFDDEATCLAAFDGFDAAQMTCVEGELDAFEGDGMTQHCSRAMGSGPCG